MLPFMHPVSTRVSQPESLQEVVKAHYEKQFNRDQEATQEQVSLITSYLHSNKPTCKQILCRSLLMDEARQSEAGAQGHCM